jgi:hypothetical protein
MAQKEEHTYIAKPNSVATAGLENVDFDKVKFISFMMENGRRLP